MNSTPSSNLTFSSPYYVESTSITVARLTFVTIIALVGLVGNILVCIVIVSKKLRGSSSMHTYLLNLALADIGVLIIIFPLGVLRERQPHYWPFGRFVCEVVFPTVDTLFGASIWFITAIAVQRYQNIVKKKELHRPRTSTKKTACIVGSIWVTSFLVLSLPLLFVVEYEEISDIVIRCQLKWIRKPWLGSVYTVVRVVFSYVVPLAFISWTYFEIWLEIRKSIVFHKSLEKESGRKNKMSRRSGENTRARKILTPIVLTFAFTMLPQQLLSLLGHFWKPMLSLQHVWTIYNIVVIVTITNSAINPIIYSVVSKDFRKAFVHLISKKDCKPGGQTGTFLLSRSRSDRATQERNSSFNLGKPKQQTPGSIKELFKSEKLRETIL